jgi:hypothetical protein
MILDLNRILCVYPKVHSIFYRPLEQRGALAVHSALCTMMSAAVPCKRARDGKARHVAGEGRAASAIGGESERTLSERDR